MFFLLLLWMLMILCHETTVVKCDEKKIMESSYPATDDINVLQRQLMSNDYPHWRDENYDDLWLLRDNKRSYVAHAEGDDAEQAEADSEDEGEQSEIEETNEEPEESPPAEDETVNEETEAAPLEYTDYDASKTEKSGNDEYEEVDMASSQNIVCNSTVLLNIIFSISLHLIITQGW
ncbi:uncharacterized protein LOC107046054 isoform X2 [Diachasma alloeum]|uniref:uncharacterized protein LOC107046054 isoform X2 n=1 Tax=Diachasma alloeum TaxID=454923 RepID=UPI0007383944|nr:uncharacterized protein LOC107046054 isoform X2 [Diachasma alloeum]